MRTENTPPNFSAKEQIIYEIAASLQFFNYKRGCANCLTQPLIFICIRPSQEYRQKNFISIL